MAGYGSPGPGRSPNLTDDGDSRRDSHDLSIATGGRGRESLLDNLLLSFDNIGGGIGPFGALESSPYFSPVDEVDDCDSVYSRRTRSGSVGGSYNPPFGGRRLDGEYVGGGYEGGSFGVTYDSRGRDTQSRGGRGLESAHGKRGGPSEYLYDQNLYDSAPAPSIRTRNRTPSPPHAPRLVRRPSNKSIKSLRRGDQFFYNPSEHVALPPLPAFAQPAPAPVQTPQPMANVKPSRPGFFRRVFGGGGSSSSGQSSNTKPNSAGGPPPSTPPAPQQLPPLEPPPPMQSVITKKASFFRRRKKSVSNIDQHPMPSPPPPPAPIKTVESAPAIEDFPTTPGISSLRHAMKPYIPSPAWAPNGDPRDNREPVYLDRNATIRTVASSDPISPRRPSFFGESPRYRDDTSRQPDSGDRKYKKETWNVRSSTANGEQTPTPRQLDSIDRPQTSPPSPSPLASLNRTFFSDKDDDEKDMNWPPRSRKMSTSRLSENSSLGTEWKAHDSIVLPIERPRQSSVASGASKEQAIADLKEFERQQAEVSKPKVSEKIQTPLELNTANLEPPKSSDRSWFISPHSPAASGTPPTVTLQREGAGESVVLEKDPGAEIKEEGFSDNDREKAQKIFDGDEDFIAKDKAAAWLGDADEDRTNVRKAYMSLFDFSGVNILSAMRIFCGRLVFKGETQQVDRIMDAFAQRWCRCNPSHGFKNADVVHTIIYSILLLNTDLHMADIASSQRMTRSQFLKNTMSTIKRGLADTPVTTEEPEAKNKDKLSHPQTLPPPRAQTPFRDNEDEGGSSPTFTAQMALTFPMPANHKGHQSRPSLEFGREFRGSRISRLGNLSPRLPDERTEKSDFDMDGGLALVSAPVGGSIRVWETQVEIVLKDFYQSVKAVALPLHGSDEKVEAPPSNSLSVFGAGGMLRRSPSTVSKAPSELSVAGRQREAAKLDAKWQSKNRSRQRVYNGSYAGSSRTSLEERSSMWSPSASSTWSKHSLNKTQTSMSVDSLGSTFMHGDYQQSIGFANALSHAIIREEAASGHSGDASSDLDVLLDGDDELELSGAPWAKEGLLKHKHHLDSVDKRAKNRSWTECFAVIQRGYMRLFQFPSKSSGKTAQQLGGVVGGGNWTENAEPIGSFLLRQTIASALPPPGYSKARPNVWALSLPSGAVHFFEVGTADIVKEFVSTANYWSARLSKEPLIGGVSNVEYGWSDNIVDLSAATCSPPSSRQSDMPMAGRPSLQMSIRSSFDQGGSGFRPRLPGDKVHIKDWMPPTQSMVASSLKEQDQLRALEMYVGNIEAELQRHNDLRSAMLIAFSPRHPNSARALNNWEKKSSYLLREIIKFRTYIETLQSAIARRKEFVAEKLKVPPLPDDDEEQTPKANKTVRPPSLDLS